MFRKVCSILYLISGILVALGGLGHSFGAVGQIHAALDGSTVDPRIVRLIVAVWHFAGAAMATLGAMVAWSWVRARSGGKVGAIIPSLLSVFYVVYGLGALTWMHEPFWAIFVVYGLLVGLSAWGMDRRLS